MPQASRDPPKGHADEPAPQHTRIDENGRTWALTRNGYEVLIASTAGTMNSSEAVARGVLLEEPSTHERAQDDAATPAS